MTTYAEIQQAIDEGAEPEVLRERVLRTLAGIAEGRFPLQAVRHPLGFTCLPVERTGGDGVCVHFWPALPSPLNLTTSAVHSHSWDLLSHVLHGRIRNTLIEVTDAPADPAYRVYEVHSAGDVDDIRATDRLVRTGAVTVETHTVGDVYALPAGGFHTTEVEPGRTAVTVALGRTAPDRCDLSLGPVDGRSHQAGRVRCAASETAVVAREITRLLSQP